MSNSFFHFKQFTIKQDKCAMKVSTDACIFGAMLQPCAGAKKALDIGAGTGLLSLMLAQRNINLQIDAVELIEDAYLQAKQNVAESKYASQMDVHLADIKMYQPNITYDFIFSNPPFFENDLEAVNTDRNIARHAKHLSLEELMVQCKRLLSEVGEVAIIIPSHRSVVLQNYAKENQLYLKSNCKIRHHSAKLFTKEVHVYSALPVQLYLQEFTIKEMDGNYTAMMQALMKEFYL